jgi:hypothetical protein
MLLPAAVRLQRGAKIPRIGHLSLRRTALLSLGRGRLSLHLRSSRCPLHLWRGLPHPLGSGAGRDRDWNSE